MYRREFITLGLVRACVKSPHADTSVIPSVNEDAAISPSKSIEVTPAASAALLTHILKNFINAEAYLESSFSHPNLYRSAIANIETASKIIRDKPDSLSQFEKIYDGWKNAIPELAEELRQLKSQSENTMNASRFVEITDELAKAQIKYLENLGFNNDVPHSQYFSPAEILHRLLIDLEESESSNIYLDLTQWGNLKRNIIEEKHRKFAWLESEEKIIDQPITKKPPVESKVQGELMSEKDFLYAYTEHPSVILALNKSQPIDVIANVCGVKIIS